MKNSKILFMTQGALIAAVYVALSFVAYSFGLSGNAVVQMRLSEVLTVLPAFMPAAIPGLTIGCLLTNILTGGAVWDIVFGTLATLLGALGTFALRKNKWLAPIPPILANARIIPPVLIFAYGATEAYWFILLTVTAGEVLACAAVGYPLMFMMRRYRLFSFPLPKKKK